MVIPEKISAETPIVTERLFLRPFTLEDAGAFHAVFGDSEVMAHIPSGVSLTPDDSRRRLQRIMDMETRIGMTLWAVVEKASCEIVGDCGLFPIEGKGPEIEVAYHLRKSAWGMGYAAEACRACLAYAFRSLELLRVVALVDANHAASRRVIEKAGLQFQGTGRYYQRDYAVFALDRDDCLELGE